MNRTKLPVAKKNALLNREKILREKEFFSHEKNGIHLYNLIEHLF